MKQTRQGVRDLNNGAANPPRHRHVSRCHHIWTHAVTYDCWTETRIAFERCELCHETRGPW